MASNLDTNTAVIKSLDGDKEYETLLSENKELRRKLEKFIRRQSELKRQAIKADLSTIDLRRKLLKEQKNTDKCNEQLPGSGSDSSNSSDEEEDDEEEDDGEDDSSYVHSEKAAPNHVQSDSDDTSGLSESSESSDDEFDAATASAMAYGEESVGVSGHGTKRDRRLAQVDALKAACRNRTDSVYDEDSRNCVLKSSKKGQRILRAARAARVETEKKYDLRRKKAVQRATILLKRSRDSTLAAAPAASMGATLCFTADWSTNGALCDKYVTLGRSHQADPSSMQGMTDVEVTSSAYLDLAYRIDTLEVLYLSFQLDKQSAYKLSKMRIFKLVIGKQAVGKSFALFYPQTLLYLDVGDAFDNKLADIPRSVKQLVLGAHFNQSLRDLPPNLTHLAIMSTRFNSSLAPLSDASSIQALKIKAPLFNQDFVGAYLPSLQTLSLHSDVFNKALGLNDSITEVKLVCKKFNRNINSVFTTCTRLRKLLLDTAFNQTLTLTSTCTSLVSLSIKGNFNQKLDTREFTRLEFLEVGDQMKEVLIVGNTVNTLKLGNLFKDMTKLEMFAGNCVANLKIGDCFNADFDCDRFTRLTNLRFGDAFNSSVLHPQKLLEVRFGNDFDQELSTFEKLEPSSMVQKLVLGENFSQKIGSAYFPHMQRIVLGSSYPEKDKVALQQSFFETARRRVKITKQPA